MAFSSATLFYGITVKALDLCIAGMAFSEVKPTLLAIDLILTRKAAGSLTTTVLPGQVDVSSLPADIWDIVKLKLCAVSYAREYGRLELRYHPCLSTDEYWDWDNLGHEEEPRTFSRLLSTESGWDEFFSEMDVPEFAYKWTKAVANLLEYFGLCMPSSALISKEGKDVTYNLEAAWAVAIPLIGDQRQVYPTMRLDTPQHLGPAVGLSRISPSALTVPVDAVGRFRRLLASYPAVAPMPCVDHTIRALGEEVSPQVKDEARPSWVTLSKLEKERIIERTQAKRQAECKAAREPAWMLYGRT